MSPWTYVVRCSARARLANLLRPSACFVISVLVLCVFFVLSCVASAPSSSCTGMHILVAPSRQPSAVVICGAGVAHRRQVWREHRARRLGRMATRHRTRDHGRGRLLAFFDWALCREFRAWIWLEADCETCMLRRFRRGRRKNRDLERTRAWFDSQVWPCFRASRAQQLRNAPGALRLDAVESDTLSAAAAYCRAVLLERQLDPRLPTPMPRDCRPRAKRRRA